MPITTVDELREHTVIALEVELATIPPYLYAMYSIADQTSEAALLIRSIVAEEMLHAALVTNLLLAVGGRPRFETTDHIPRYPCDLPHHRPPLRLDLAPASAELIEGVFMTIEQPELHGAPAEPDEYETLGQFYHALEQGIAGLAMDVDLFADPQLSCQMGDPSYYSPVEYDAEDSGGLLAIDSVETAIEAIEIIVHQGEGLSNARWADPLHQELTHYFKLAQIADGTSPLGDVRPVPTNPRTADYPPDVRVVSELFNLAYRQTFEVLAEMATPESDSGACVGKLYSLMTSVMGTLARYLVRLPINGDLVAAPTFEVVEPADQEKLDKLGSEISESHPELSGTVETLVGISEQG